MRHVRVSISTLTGTVGRDAASLASAAPTTSCGSQQADALKRGVDVLEVGLVVEDAVECLAVEAVGHLGVGLEERSKRRLLVPRGHRVTLHDLVGALA